jgi:DNA repair exonuclease SbcCD ATPase subunit
VSGPPGIEEACTEIVALREEIVALKRQLEEQQVIAKFWRQAAEHAVAGWNDLEDRYEDKLEKLRNIEAMLSLTIGDDREEWAPPITDDPQTIDLGDGVKLTVIEDETPVK